MGLGLALAELESRLFGRPKPTVVVQRYVLLRRIASGGAGTVFAAYDPELDRRVAVKLLRGDAHDPTLAERRVDEARALARLAHPNVITVHDAGVIDGAELARDDPTLATDGEVVTFLVMELVEGTTLADWLRARPRGLTEQLAAFRAAGHGLAAAHRAGLVHRDVKPTNVVVGDDGRVRVIDFGLARAAAGRADAGSSGTPLYMAPEQHDGGPLDARSDQYAFCVALAEAVLGRPPFAIEGLAALVVAKRDGRVDLSGSMPGWLRRVLLRGLAPDPSDRHPDMDALIAVIERGMGRRRRVAIIGTAVLGACAVAVVARAGTARCDDPSTRLDGVWDEGRRIAIEQAFAREPAPWAADSSQAVVRAFDEFSAAWTSAHTDACEATLVRGEATSDVMVARMSCLERQLARFDAVVATVSAGDRAVLERAAESARLLPSPQDCAADRELDERQEDPERRERQLELERAFARAEAFTVSGRGADAMAELDAAEPLVAALAHPPSTIRAWILRGAGLREQGRFDDAMTALHRAWVEAERADEHELAVKALVGLVLVAGHDARKVGEADRWAELALAKQQAHGVDPLIEADLLRNVGVLRSIQARYDEAATLLEQALAITERTLGEDHPRAAVVLGAIGTLASARGDYASARVAQLRTLELSIAEVGERHPRIGAGLLNLGAMERALGDYANAEQNTRLALGILREAYGPEHPNVALAMNNYAAVLLGMGRFDEAIDHLRRALELRRTQLGPEAPGVATVESNLGAALHEVGREEEALALDRHALAIRVASFGEEHPDTASVRVNLAATLLALGEIGDARREIDAALAGFEKAYGADSPMLVEPLRVLGEVDLVESDREAATLVLERAVLLSADGASEPVIAGDARFALARAVAERDRSRALMLADEADGLWRDLPRDTARRTALAQWRATMSE